MLIISYTISIRWTNLMLLPLCTYTTHFLHSLNIRVWMLWKLQADYIYMEQKTYLLKENNGSNIERIKHYTKRIIGFFVVKVSDDRNHHPCCQNEYNKRIRMLLIEEKWIWWQGWKCGDHFRWWMQRHGECKQSTRGTKPTKKIDGKEKRSRKQQKNMDDQKWIYGDTKVTQ